MFCFVESTLPRELLDRCFLAFLSFIFLFGGALLRTSKVAPNAMIVPTTWRREGANRPRYPRFCYLLFITTIMWKQSTLLLLSHQLTADYFCIHGWGWVGCRLLANLIFACRPQLREETIRWILLHFISGRFGNSLGSVMIGALELNFQGFICRVSSISWRIVYRFLILLTVGCYTVGSAPNPPQAIIFNTHFNSVSSNMHYTWSTGVRSPHWVLLDVVWLQDTQGSIPSLGGLQ